MKQILRTIDRWRFEVPLALLLGGAACFALLAMPAPIFAAMPLVGGLGRAGQMAAAILAGLVAGGLAYVAMRPRRPAPVRPALEAVDPEEEERIATRRSRVRRADAHPDAPPREPIRASRDLGEPFMEVRKAPGEFGQKSLPVPEAEFTEVTEAEPLAMAESELVAEAPESAEVDQAPTPEPILLTAVEPVDEPPAADPTPEPVPVAPVAEPIRVAPVARAGRESLDEMMDRLAAGLARRAHTAPAPRPTLAMPDPQIAFRQALEELNRLSASRH
jgi:hypothetical protein